MKIFIGYDKRFDAAYRVAKHSVLQIDNTLEVIPLKIDKLKNYLWREKDPLASTEFTITRFLVPYLSDYMGYSLFVDCDVLFKENPRNIIKEIEHSSDVYCVPHNYTPFQDIKMDNRKQHVYPRKNWSSVMLFNNYQCQYLNLRYINSATPSELHQMMWAQSIGKLDPKWNHLVGYYNHPNPSIIHYTDGGPWISGYENCEYSEEWIKNYNDENETRY